MDIDRWGRESEGERRRRERRRGRQRKRSREGERETERRRDGDKELIRFPLPSRRLISYSSLCPLSFFVCDFYCRLVCLFVRSSVRSFVAFFFRRPFRLLFASRFPPRAVRTTGPPPSPRALSRKVRVGVCGRDREGAAAW